MFVANRAIVIRKAHETDIKSIIPIENAEEYLLNRVGDVLLIHDGLGHKVVTDGEFEKTYDVVKSGPPWMLVKPKNVSKLLDIVDEMIENYPNESKTAENGYAQATKGRPKYGVDKNFIKKPDENKETVTEKSDRYGKAIRTTHYKTDMLALEITKENYSIAAALLPQKFTTIDPKEVEGYFVVINDRTVSIDERGISTTVGLNNWACHPDIFHDIFIAVDFAYGDFLHCYREGK